MDEMIYVEGVNKLHPPERYSQALTSYHETYMYLIILLWVKLNEDRKIFKVSADFLKLGTYVKYIKVFNLPNFRGQVTDSKCKETFYGMHFLQHLFS